MQHYTAGREEVNCLSPMVHQGKEFSISQGLFQLCRKKNQTTYQPNFTIIFLKFFVHQTQYTLFHVSGTCIINKNTRPTSFTESLKVLVYARELHSVSQTCIFTGH